MLQNSVTNLDPATIYPVVFQRPPAIPIDSIHPKPSIQDLPKNIQTPEEVAEIILQLLDALAPD